MTPPATGSRMKRRVGCATLIVVALLLGIGSAAIVVVLTQERLAQMTPRTAAIEDDADVAHDLQALEAEHPFRAPAGDIIGNIRARRFVRIVEASYVASAAWTARWEVKGRPEPGSEERRAEEAEAEIGELFAAERALVRELADRKMPLSEFLWTADALRIAYENVERGLHSKAVRRENKEVARRYRRELARIAGSDRQSADWDLMVALAVVMAERHGVVLAPPPRAGGKE